MDIVNTNRSIIAPYCELVDEASLKYNTEVVNNDERIEENSFLNNGDVIFVNQSGITDFETTSPLFLQNDEEISRSIQYFNVKSKFLIMF